MSISTLEVEVLCSGQDGSAAGAVLSASPLSGLLKAIYIEREGSGGAAMPDTNTVRVSDDGPPSMTLLFVQGKTDVTKLYAPKNPTHHIDGEPILYDGVSSVGADFPLTGKIKVEANHANNGDKITVTIMYE